MPHIKSFIYDHISILSCLMQQATSCLIIFSDGTPNSRFNIALVGPGLFLHITGPNIYAERCPE